MTEQTGRSEKVGMGDKADTGEKVGMGTKADTGDKPAKPDTTKTGATAKTAKIAKTESCSRRPPTTFAFEARVELVGINPFVRVPEPILASIFAQAGRDKGPIPIAGTVNKKAYRQTLVRYRGLWRLYINTMMLAHSPERIGELIEVTVAFDPESRALEPHPKLVQALEAHAEAKAAFESLSPSRRHEIVRYIAALKTEESVERNVARALAFLTGEARFVGRDRP